MSDSTSSSVISAMASELNSASEAPAVGLSDPQYASWRRKMLDVTNKLHNTGVQYYMDLPTITAIGSQSAGKSSLIESFSGITLPRASGTCTRCPIECRLSSSTEPWMCKVSLRFLVDANGKPLKQVRNEPFGEPIYDKSQVEDRVRRAQRAILNPDLLTSQFLEDSKGDVSKTQVSFSANTICLQISGTDVADLSFCDLPGLIASGDDQEVIENLVASYVSKPSCIILLTVAGETDWDNQRGYYLAQKHDPLGERTIGVITKPDRIPRGDEESWIRYIKSEDRSLANGWFTVKQPDPQELKDRITWEEARAAEREWFTTHAPWSSLEFEWQQHLGRENLMSSMSDLLSSLIAKRLPELHEEVQRLMEQTQDELRQLPKPPSPDAQMEILHLISDFVRDVTRHLEGMPQEDGLLQLIRPAEEKFKLAIRFTAPDFRAHERKRPSVRFALKEDEKAEGSGSEEVRPEVVPYPDFLTNEDKYDFRPQNDSNAIFIDEVMQRARKAITRELPDFYPFVVSDEYVKAVIAKWNAPARALYDTIFTTLNKYLKGIIAEHFGKFSQGGLQHHVTAVVTDHVKKCGESTLSRIDWLLDIERRPRTLNTHYYQDYRDKFLAYYRAWRHMGSSGGIFAKLEKYSSRSSSKSEFGQSTAKVLAGLMELGISGVKASDLPKLLPSDPMEPALHIMATVRAYFQVAYKRFADNVPMTLDHELILGLDKDRGLENALLTGLGVTGPDGPKRCKEYLLEPPQVVAQRERLQEKLRRLEAAKKEMLDIWM